MGSSFPSKTLPGARLELFFGEGDSVVIGLRGRAACLSSPVPGNRVGSHIPSDLVAGSSARPFISCLGWSQRIPRHQTCPNAPGRLSLGLLPGWGAGRAPQGSRVSQGSTWLYKPLQPPACPRAWHVSSAIQRWVSRVSEGSLRWDCGCVRPCILPTVCTDGVSGCVNAEFYS